MPKKATHSVRKVTTKRSNKVTKPKPICHTKCKVKKGKGIFDIIASLFG